MAKADIMASPRPTYLRNASQKVVLGEIEGYDRSPCDGGEAVQDRIEECDAYLSSTMMRETVALGVKNGELDGHREACERKQRS